MQELLMQSNQNYNRTSILRATSSLGLRGVFLLTLMMNATPCHGQSVQGMASVGTVKAGETLILKVLINHILDLFDVQAAGSTMRNGTLEDDAAGLVSVYQSSALRSGLTDSQVTDGLGDCHEVQHILLDPNAEYELSDQMRNELMRTVDYIIGDLEDASPIND
tara:strand:- start:150305 stop:150796 length:492 start_codon:yes stop_codon:yes gene_type:complete